MNASIIDVYYVPYGKPGAFCGTAANIIRSWDGSVYIECNVPQVAGELRLVQWSDDGILWIEGHMLNGGLSMHDKYKLKH